MDDRIVIAPTGWTGKIVRVTRGGDLEVELDDGETIVVDPDDVREPGR